MGLFSVGAKGVKAGSKVSEGLLDGAMDMMFIHGTDADKLSLYDMIGGQPMPSLAVTQKDIPFSWGDIDLIGKKGSFAPESNSLNDLYSTDAYTVRSNMPLRKAKKDAGDLFRKRYGNIGSYASELDNSDLASVEINDYFNGRFGMGPAKFAEEKGIPAVKKPDGSVSHIKTKHFIRDNHGPEYKEWMQEQMDYLFEPEIYRMKLGKMVPYDVGDMTEEMVKKRGIGTEGVFDGTGYDKAIASTKFKSLDEAKAARSALMEKDIADTKYSEMDYEGMAPTQYFESKPARPVKFNEYAGAIVPENIDARTLKILENRGIPVEKYTDEAGRLAARDRFKSEMFAHPMTGAATGLLGLNEFNRTERMGEFDNRFKLPKGQQRGSILPVITNDQGFVELGLPQFVVDTARGLFDVGQSRKTGVINPASLLEIL